MDLGDPTKNHTLVTLLKRGDPREHRESWGHVVYGESEFDQRDYTSKGGGLVSLDGKTEIPYSGRMTGLEVKASAAMMICKEQVVRYLLKLMGSETTEPLSMDILQSTGDLIMKDGEYHLRLVSSYSRVEDEDGKVSGKEKEVVQLVVDENGVRMVSGSSLEINRGALAELAGGLYKLHLYSTEQLVLQDADAA